MFGSGSSIRPPAPELIQELRAQGIGLEVSNTVRLPDTITSSHAHMTKPSTMDTWLFVCGVALGAADAREVVRWSSVDILNWPAHVHR